MTSHCSRVLGRISRAFSSAAESTSDEPPSPSTPFERPQLEIRNSRRGFGIVGLLSTSFVLFTTGGTASLILGWLSAFHDPVEGGGILSTLRNGSFVIMEPSGSEESFLSQTNTETLRILLFSALASHLISITSAVLVTLLSYRAATQWLRASEDPDNANLTPIQYGLLVRTLGSGSLMSIINTLRYTSRSRRANAPRFFTEALISVTGIYLLGHTVGMVDLWLHSSARSISVVRAIPIESQPSYGITYDENKCGSFNKTELPCQKLIGWWNGVPWWASDSQQYYAESYNTLWGLNPYKKVEYLNDTAIFVPGPGRNFRSKGFAFNTYGLRVECKTLRDQCDRLPAPLIELGVPGATPVTNCSKAGYPRIPYYTSGELLASGRDTRNIKSFVIGIIGDEMGGMIHGTPDFSSGWTSNPASVVIQLRWLNNTPHWNTDTPGVVYTNALDLYATCTMTYLDVIAQFDPISGDWSILETNLSQPELASVFWTPMIFQVETDDLLHAMKPYLLNRGAQALDVLEASMAQYSMAYASFFMAFTEAFNVTTPQVITLGLYPTAPTLLLVGCLYIYSLIALVMLVFACISNSRIIFVPRHLTKEGEKDEERSALDVAQTWLTDPLPFIGALYPGGDGRHVARSAESDPLRQVYDSDSELRKVGIGLYKGATGEMIFGLMRQNPSRSRRYGCVFTVVDEEGMLGEKVSIRGSALIVPSLALVGETDLVTEP
ncbi:hypothetical protein FRC04_002431 [Tulasnella sp. 424]|nr:hypothetical protein FRC04_002431 [Tulasnella sp. 424]KAG8967375.1 hypothetical protein FRC05_002085 [Tulasnella sp. 425]